MNDIRMKLIQLMMEVHFQIPAEQFHAANRINWHIFHQTTNPMMSHREGVIWVTYQKMIRVLV